MQCYLCVDIWLRRVIHIASSIFALHCGYVYLRKVLPYRSAIERKGHESTLASIADWITIRTFFVNFSPIDCTIGYFSMGERIITTCIDEPFGILLTQEAHLNNSAEALFALLGIKASWQMPPRSGTKKWTSVSWFFPPFFDNQNRLHLRAKCSSLSTLSSARVMSCSEIPRFDKIRTTVAIFFCDFSNEKMRCLRRDWR